MLLLKGNAGKSVIVERLSNYANTFVYGYVEEIPCYIEGMKYVLSSEASYVLSREVSIEMFCHDIEEDILGKGICEIVIIYTNLLEEEILPIKNIIEKLESVNCFRIGIITCK